MRIVMSNDSRVTGVRRMVTSVMTWMVMGVAVMTGGATSPRTRIARIVVIIGAVTIVVVLRLVLLSLAVLFALHSTILEPDLDLALRQVEVSCQFPTFLFRHIGIEEEFFFQF